MENLQEWKVERPWLETHCGLAEGPFYEEETKSVRFVDIKGKRVHSASIAEGQSSLTTTQLDACPTVTSDIEGVDPSERILLGMKYGIAVLDRKSGTYEVIKQFNEPNNERLRSNDGAAGPNGQFWLGTMTDFGLGPFQAEGSLYRFSSDQGKDEVFKDLTIPNSVGWSADKKTMFFTHSTAREVLALDYDESTGSVSNKRLFYKHDGPGEPDGFRIDVEGNIWHAVYGESRVLKISPEGKLIGQILLPTKNITCVQFVGTELVITSAADEDGEGLSKEYGGCVFRVDVGIEGLKLFKFKL